MKSSLNALRLAPAETAPSKQLSGVGGRRKESNHALLQLDTTFLGSKIHAIPYKETFTEGGEKMPEPLFAKEKVMKENLQI